MNPTHSAILASAIRAPERVLAVDSKEAIIDRLTLGKRLLAEYQQLSAEYDALYRANGPKARGRRRGLRFRIAEIAEDPAFQFQREAYDHRPGLGRGLSQMTTLLLAAGAFSR